MAMLAHVGQLVNTKHDWFHHRAAIVAVGRGADDDGHYLNMVCFNGKRMDD